MHQESKRDMLQATHSDMGIALLKYNKANIILFTALFTSVAAREHVASSIRSL